MKRRVIILLYVAVVLIVVSCRRENATGEQGAEPSATPATVTTTAPPVDLANAKVNTVIPPADGIFIDQARLGAELGQNGMVENETTTFAPGTQVYLSMWFRESPAGLQASFVLADAGGKEIARGAKAMNGQKTVTFPVADPKLKPGQYQVTGYWGGNVAAEYKFRIR